MADSGEGPGGRPSTSFLDQTEARRAEKNFFFRPGLPLISGSGYLPLHLELLLLILDPVFIQNPG